MPHPPLNTQAMEEYDFATATQRVYSLWQNEVCDVFIEVMKPVMALDESKVGYRGCWGMRVSVGVGACGLAWVLGHVG